MREDPKWNISKACVQDHEHYVNNYYYTTTVKNTTPFNVPKKGNELEIGFDNVVSLLSGSILWNPNIGSLLVKSFDKDRQTAVVTTYDNKTDYGKSVLANTEWVVAIPNGISDKKEYLDTPYLAADFISPAPGSCQEASVTSISGLRVNDSVSISGFVYRIGAIINRNTLKLCNDGQGADSGFVIHYDPIDCNEPGVPIIVYESNPCEATPTATGNIVACKDGRLTTIKGEADGQLLRWNNIHKRWELANAYLEENCTYLTTCMTIDTLDQSYIANVKTTVIFNLDNKVIIEDNKFLVDEIISDTQVKLKPEKVFDEIVTYPSGTMVCLESCCSWVPSVLYDTILDNNWVPLGLRMYMQEPPLVDDYKWRTKFNVTGNNTVPAPVDTNLTDLDNSHTNETVSNGTITITNFNKKYKLRVYVRMYSYAHGVVQAKDNAAETAKLLLKLDSNITIGYNKLVNDVVQAATPLTFNEFDNKVAKVYDDNGLSADRNNVKGTIFSMYVAQEFVYFDIPPYSDDYPSLSVVTISGSTVMNRVAGGSTGGVAYQWGDRKERGSLISHLVINSEFQVNE